MYTLQEPTYIDTDGCEYQYTPHDGLCSLRRYNIAQCARQRMYDANCATGNERDWFELWKRERVSFWATLAQAIPSTFK